MHLIQRNNKYVLYNEDSMDFYTINEELGKKLKALGDEGISNLIPKGEVIECDFTKEGKKLNRLILVISQECNLGCRYCYAQQGSYGEANARFMNMDTINNTIKFILERYPEGIESIQFFGGEPLTNYKLMIEACEWIVEKFNKENLELPQFTIVTNGTILNEEIIDTFNKYNFSVTISLDGNKEVNDTNRIFKGNNNSVFDKVKSTIEILNKDRNYNLCIEMTVNESNINQFVDTDYNILDIEEIHRLNPEVIHIVPAAWKDDEDRYSKEYTRNIEKYFDMATKYSIDSLRSCNPINIVKVLDMASGLIGKKKKKNFCSAGVGELSVSVNGDIYPCFTLINEEKFKMGNVNNDINNSQYITIQNKLRSNTYDSVKKCQDCWAKGICTSCIGNAYLVNGSIDKPIENFCAAQRAQLERIMIECEKMLLRK